MAKKVDYPRASFRKAIELADAVDELGGQCALDLAADKVGMKVGGGFLAVVGAAVKHGLITKKADRLQVTPLFKDYKLSYNQNEEYAALTTAFALPPLYKAIIQRFDKAALPLSHLDRVLVREFDVPENIASRVAKYFVDASKHLGLLTGNNKLSLDRAETVVVDEKQEVTGKPTAPYQASVPQSAPNRSPPPSGKYSVSIQGPSINSVVTIDSDSDIAIVNAMLRKIEQSLLDAVKEEPSDGN